MSGGSNSSLSGKVSVTGGARDVAVPCKDINIIVLNSFLKLKAMRDACMTG